MSFLEHVIPYLVVSQHTPLGLGIRSATLRHVAISGHLTLSAPICDRLAGFLVTIWEAPFLCMFIDFVQTISKKMENSSAYFKGALYVG